MTPETLRELEALYRDSQPDIGRTPYLGAAGKIYYAFPALLAELRRLETERDKLRGALRSIAAGGPGIDGNIARAALAGPGEQPDAISNQEQSKAVGREPPYPWCGQPHICIPHGFCPRNPACGD